MLIKIKTNCIINISISYSYDIQLSVILRNITIFKYIFFWMSHILLLKFNLCFFKQIHFLFKYEYRSNTIFKSTLNCTTNLVYLTINAFRNQNISIEILRYFYYILKWKTIELRRTLERRKIFFIYKAYIYAIWSNSCVTCSSWEMHDFSVNTIITITIKWTVLWLLHMYMLGATNECDYIAPCLRVVNAEDICCLNIDPPQL